MSKHVYKGFEPKWYKEEYPKNSYRAVFRWGDPHFHKYIKESLYEIIKDSFKMADEDFKQYTCDLGIDEIKLNKPCGLDNKHIEFFKGIVGNDFVRTDDYSRASVAYGKTMYDILRMRKHILDNVPDVVIYPSEKEQIQAIVAYCNDNKIPLYVYGGGSSVTRGVEPVKGGVSLDMRLRYNKVINFNEIDQTITVQTGLSGPDLEKHLNNAVSEFNAKRAYTCGHFPQSFEFSSVGGWVVTRGAGQNSTYYGKIEDIVLSQEYATPKGVIKTTKYIREATGPSLDQIMMGSEGTFGILTEVTLRVFRFMPKNRKRYCYMFKNWETAMEATREMMQCECGYSSVFRLSDQHETKFMMRLYGISDTVFEKALAIAGYKIGEAALFLGFTEGEKGFAKNVRKKIGRIARKYKGFPLGGWVCKSWEKGRFNDPYLRDSLQDFGILTDTIECTVNWSNMEAVHQSVRKVCVAYKDAICITHLSHAYPQGANLYFIFFCKMNDPEEFRKYHASILDAIQKSGASMSHHHGIGKMFGPWLEGYVGENEYEIYKVLKKHFDPNNVMNPGGTLGLDLDEKDKRNLK